MDRKVVITGLGLISPLGNSVEESWKSLIQGRSGIRRVRSPISENLPYSVAGEIKDFDPERFIPKRKSIKLMNKGSQLVVAAANMAIADSGITPCEIGLALGIGGTQYAIEDTVEAVYASLTEDMTLDHQRFGREGLKSLNPIWPFTLLPNMALCHVSILHNIQGPNVIFSSIASAGVQAIGESAKKVREEEVPIFLAGGCDTINPICMTSFFLKDLLSPSSDIPEEVCCPFDLRRNGLVLGEGAALLVVEDLIHAQKRGAKIYAEILGYSSCVYGLGEMPGKESFAREALGAENAMRRALQDADISPEEIDYINAEGRSCEISDWAESEAIKRVFGDYAHKVPVSSNKSMIGHLLCASGPAELIFSILSINEDIIPPTINYHHPDPRCDLDYVPNEAREKKVDIVMSNTFGPEGDYSTLIVKRFS
jgi:3-oxoacyl-[acyl-carrier-protein] synthase II